VLTIKRQIVGLLFFLGLLSYWPVSATLIQPSPASIKQLAIQVFKNECNSNPDYLIHWNPGENFASLGIGHFIWYQPDHVYDSRPVFEETFPDLIRYLSKRTSAPTWIQESLVRDKLDLPWRNKQSFDRAKSSVELKQLQDWLNQTHSLQAAFIFQRFNDRLQTKLSKSSMRTMISARLIALMSDPTMSFVLVDYAHFKGIGFTPKETYSGKGWGLLNVIEEMSPPFDKVQFKQKAIELLERRVLLSAPSRNEARWLAGWKNRIEGY